MVAIVPLSWYLNGSVAALASSLTICAAACFPIWMAGWASWGVGSSGLTAMSPTAKIRSWPVTRRSGPTVMRPFFPWGSPQPATAGAAATPAAHTVRPLGRSSPSASSTWSAVTSAIRVFSLMSTPRLTSCVRAYSRSFSWNGPSSEGDISTSRTCTRDGSTSGKVAPSTVARSSAAVPASSTPVAPPPTTVMDRSPPATLSRSNCAIM